MLKTALIQGLRGVAAYIPLPLLQLLSRQRLLLLFYHTVSDKPLPHVRHLYHVRNTALFAQDLDYLLKYFEPIDLVQLIAHIHEGKPLPKNSFFLTFDDGLAECYHVIAPILKQKGIPATFFLNSDFVDNKALMFRYKASYLIEHLQKKSTADKVVKEHFNQYKIPYTTLKDSLLRIKWGQQKLLDDLAANLEIDFENFLKTQQPYLSSNQIQAMLNDGFTFGSHSQNHPTYNQIPLADQYTQTIESQKFVQDNFNLSYKTFAFPFTDVGVSKDFFDKILGEENFQLSFGGAGLKHEQIKGQLQRFGMESQRETDARSMIHAEYCYYLVKALFGKNVIKRM